MTSSLIYLRRVTDDQMVEGTLLDEIDAACLQHMEATWLPIIDQVKKSTPREKWPEDWHWDWRGKLSAASAFGHRSLAVICDNDLQGAMLADSAHQPVAGSQPSLYVEYLATAPWNRPAIQDPSRYRGVGSTLMAAAVQLSFEEGLKGRVTLHSLPGAEQFYGNVLGMTALGNDPQKQNLMRFGFTTEQAKSFLTSP